MYIYMYMWPNYTRPVRTNTVAERPHRHPGHPASEVTPAGLRPRLYRPDAHSAPTRPHPSGPSPSYSDSHGTNHKTTVRSVASLWQLTRHQPAR